MPKWSVIVCLLSVIPLVAQDKSAEKKDAPKKESPPAPKKYQTVGTIAGKLTKVNSDDKTIEIDHRVASGKYGRNQKDELKLADDVKIRTLKLPEKKDDKGKSVPLTDAEKQKLKGDDRKLPGYTADLTALSAGQMVETHLATNKSAASTKKNGEQEKPFVTMIVIVGEAPKKPDKDKAKTPDKEKKKP